MLESTVNYLTVLNSDESEYMAFKYFSHDYFRVLVDPEAQEEIKDKSLSDIRHCMTLLGDAEARRKAEELNASILRDGRTKTFWYQPGISNLYDCISRVADIEMRESLYFVYKSLSMSIHGTHLGMFMFRDNPDDFDINPSANPQKTPGPLLISCKLLLEFLVCRCEIEQLGLEARYSTLFDKGQSLYEAYRSTITA
jgi:hypothetical protein